MKPAPIMEEEEEGRWGREDWGGGGRDGGSRANEEERLAANAETIRLVCEEESVGWTRQRDSQWRRDHDEERGGAKKKRAWEEGAVRDESEM